MRKWYVIQLKHKQQDLAETNLMNQGFKVYHPEMIEVRQRKGQPINVIVPLFAGYMFVRFDIDKDRWRAIGNTKGVHSLLTATEHSVCPLPKHFVEDLMKQRDKTGMLPTEKAYAVVREFLIGQQLQVDSGIFKGFTGILEALNKGRFVVLLSLLGAKKRVELSKIDVSHCTSTEVTVR